MDHVTGLWSGARLVTSVEVPEGSIASFQRAGSIFSPDLIAEVRKAMKTPVSWPCVVDEAYQGDPNKKLIGFGGDFYVLDVTQIPL